MKIKEEKKQLRQKSISELQKDLEKERRKLAESKNQLGIGKLKKFSDIKKSKLKIAQVKTLMREKLEEEMVKENKK